MRFASLLALLLAAPSAGAYGLTIGPASVSYDFANTGECYPRVLAEACLASYEEGPEPGLGDDTLSQYRAFEAFEARIDPAWFRGAGAPWPFPDAGAEVTQDALIFPTGLGQRLADIADDLHAALPEAYRENAHAWFNEGGFIVEVRVPDAESLSEGRLAWTTSQNVVPLFITNRTHTWVPLGVAPLDSDFERDLARSLLTECSFTYQTGDAGVCPGLPAAGAFEVLNDSLPRVVYGAWVQRASFAAAPPTAPPEAVSAQVEAAAPRSVPGGAWAFPRPGDAGGSLRLEETATPVAAFAPSAPAGSEGVPLALAATTSLGASVGPPLLLLAAASAAVLAAWALLTRLRREDVLCHETRARLLAHVQAHPGCVLHHAANEVGVDYKTAQHHLRLLCHFGLVDVVRRSRGSHLFAAGQFTLGEKDAIVALRTGCAAPLMRELLAAPGMGLSGLARSSGLSKAGASRQVVHLAGAGLLVQERQGRSSKLYPTMLAHRLAPLAAVPASPRAEL